MFTVFIFPVLIVTLVACYCTSVACRLAHWRHRHVSWLIAFLGAVAAAIASSFFVLLGLSLQPGVTPYFVYFLRWTLITCIGGSLFALFPAEGVVWYYRRRFREHDHVV
jgi:hypothetical protein